MSIFDKLKFRKIADDLFDLRILEIKFQKCIVLCNFIFYNISK